MRKEPARFRPKAYPPPEFPPRRPAPFATTPPAVFPVLLGLLGLALALRAGLAHFGLSQAVADLLAAGAISLWAFGLVAYGAKLFRRPGVLFQDLKVLPARGGLAAATVGGMAAAALLAPLWPGAGRVLLAVFLSLHLLLACIIGWFLLSLPREGRGLNPGWHLILVGPIVGALAAVLLDLPGLARTILWICMPLAGVIWAGSLVQLFRRIPPAALRPMLAIHLAPASFFASVALLTGQGALATSFGLLALSIFAALLLALRWICAAGFSPLWGAFTFPLTAFAAAMIRLDGAFATIGLGGLAAALILVPLIAWRVLRQWPGGGLAAKTGAATA